MVLIYKVILFTCLSLVPIESIKDSHELCKDVFKHDVTSHNTGKPIPQSARFVGVGYNVMATAPDPHNPVAGGAEAGILFTRNILQKTYDEGKTSFDGSLSVPDQIEYSQRAGCFSVSEVIYDEESFKDEKTEEVKLSVDVGNVNCSFLELAAAANYGSNNEGLDKNVVYQDIEMCKTEEVRYLSSLVKPHNFKLTEDFAYTLCGLPSEFNDDTSDEYEYLFDSWGTHVTMTVEAGYKRLDNSYISQKDMLEFAMSNTDADSTIKAGPVEIVFDLEAASKNEAIKKHSYTKNVSACFGDEDHVAALTVIADPLSVTLKPDFWVDELCMTQDEAAQKYEAMIDALNYYPMMKDIELQESNRQITIVRRWPSGIYGLTMADTGCPEADDFKFAEGARRHKTGGGNMWAPEAGPHFVEGSYNTNKMEQYFCMKTVETPNAFPWASGKYCVFMKGETCPPNFQVGWVYWDEDGDANGIYGEVPNGQYEGNTKIYYCCRDDGYASNELYLPTDKPFYLFPTSHQCQAVNGMEIIYESFQWDDEDWFNGNDQGGFHPYVEEDSDNTIMYFCYYFKDE